MPMGSNWAWPRTNRQLLNTIQNSLNRLEMAMSAQTEYMTTALESLDVQMANLQVRLAEEAAALVAALSDATLGVEDEAALNAAAARVQATAELVAGLVQPTVVADPATPDVADPLTPETAPEGDVFSV